MQANKKERIINMGKKPYKKRNTENEESKVSATQ